MELSSGLDSEEERGFDSRRKRSLHAEGSSSREQESHPSQDRYQRVRGIYYH